MAQQICPFIGRTADPFGYKRADYESQAYTPEGDTVNVDFYSIKIDGQDYAPEAPIDALNSEGDELETYLNTLNRGTFSVSVSGAVATVSTTDNKHEVQSITIREKPSDTDKTINFTESNVEIV